jgi:CSLREA domain-containing protein
MTDIFERREDITMAPRKGVTILLVGVLVAVAAQAASAATITVNTTADDLTGGDGQCTLREALANVNAAADTTGGDCTAGSGTGDTVQFALTLPARARSATIKLALGELVIERDATIMGPTAGWLHVSGERSISILYITAGTTANVSDLIIEKALSVNPLWEYGLAPGGAIYNRGMLTLSNCTLANNKSLEGGGILNSGTMTLINCTLKNNKATSDGAAIANSGTMSLSASTLMGNRIVGGPGSKEGGGIANGGNMSLTNCTLKGNRAWHGGAISNSTTGTISLTNCTLTANKARWGAGGAITNDGTMTLTNSTITSNWAWAGRGSLGGGGIWQYPADQDPDGVGGTAIVINTIIAKNGKAGNCGGNLPFSNGHNLSDAGCFAEGGTDLVDTDPLLAPLASYGGPTKTFALCLGAGVPSRSCTGASPAIDAGDDAVTGAPLNLATDQRGLPRLSGAHVDIGTYEAQQ